MEKPAQETEAKPIKQWALFEAFLDEAFAEVTKTTKGGATVARLKQSVRETIDVVEELNIDLSAKLMEVMPRIVRLAAGFVDG